MELKRKGEDKFSLKEKKLKFAETKSNPTFQRVFADFPPGLECYSQFITEDEQSKLLKIIDEGVWSNELKRRVQHFGYRYDYKSKNLDKSHKIGALPEFCNYVIERLLENKIISKKPDQLIINGML